MRFQRRWIAVSIAVVILAGAAVGVEAVTTTTTAPATTQSTAKAGHPCGTVTTAPKYQHVIWIWMENHSYGDIIGNSSAPYINSIASACGVATDYHNLTHESLPNYIGATSGLPLSSLTRFTPDCLPSVNCETSAASIFGQGETWKAYEESMPSDCDPSKSAGYAARHNPPVYFTSLRSVCSVRDVPFAQLARDLTSRNLPAFSFVTPNLADDMHNGTITEGDSWLASRLRVILGSSEYLAGTTVVFITWDEGAGGFTGENCVTNTADTSCHIPLIVISPSTAAGSRSSAMFSHYSLLATTEQLLGLPYLAKASASATMTLAFHL